MKVQPPSLGEVVLKQPNDNPFETGEAVFAVGQAVFEGEPLLWADLFFIA